jgi:hypothetical protein
MAFLVEPGVLFRVRMSVFANRLASSVGDVCGPSLIETEPSGSSKSVLSVSYSFEVSRIDTGTVSTEVVDL